MQVSVIFSIQLKHLEEEVLATDLKKSQMEIDILRIKRKAAEQECAAYEAVYNAFVSMKRYFDLKIAESFPFESDT